MLEIVGNKPSATLNLDGSVNLTIKTHKSVLLGLETLKGEQFTITIKEYRHKRSLSQNAYMWVLLNKLAEKLNDTAENIYKHFIRDYGVRDYVLIVNDAVDELQTRWEKKGLGWFSEIIGKGKIDGTTTIALFYGSSTYDSKEMSRVIDAITESCEENDIPTMTINEILSLQNDND